MSTILNSARALVVVLISIWLVSSCSTRHSSECEAFLALSPAQREVESREYPLSKQIDMYLCAMKQEPPDRQLADKISDGGDEAIVLLLERLKGAKSEVDQHDLIYVFEVMSRKGYLRGQTHVVSEISEVVEAMKIAPVKEDTRERLKKIHVNSGIKPFTYVQ